MALLRHSLMFTTLALLHMEDKNGRKWRAEAPGSLQTRWYNGCKPGHALVCECKTPAGTFVGTKVFIQRDPETFKASWFDADHNLSYLLLTCFRKK